MAKSLDPPDFLAELCAAFHAWEAQDWFEGRLAQAEAILSSEPISSGMEETRFTTAWSALSQRLNRVPARAALSHDLFLEALRLLQALDRWHEPLSDPIHATTAAQDRLRTRLRLAQKDSFSYNDNVQSGRIIPPWLDPERRAARGMGKLAQLLDHTAYLPAEIRAGEADSPREVRKRRLRAYYRRGPSGLPVAPGDDRPVIALAPVLEREDDASIALNHKDGVYGVDLHYDWSRIGEIFDAALAKGARVLILPEMTIRQSDSNRLMRLFKEKVRESVAKGNEPTLFYVIAGLVAGRDEGERAGSNDVVLFHVLQDETSDPFVRQAKLCRWNLDEATQEDFLHRSHCPVLREDIDEGREINVTDLEGLGRTLTLICADMEANEPGHWLIRNIGVDWLYAPIMDRSISHRIQIDASGRPELKPWVVDRAATAVREGAMRAVVVNSLVLSVVHSATPVSRPYLPYKQCGWAFMLDNSGDDVAYRELDAPLPLPQRSKPMVQIITWLDGFEPAPAYMR